MSDPFLCVSPADQGRWGMPRAIVVEVEPGQDPELVAGMTGLAPPPIELFLRPELIANPRVHVLWFGHGIPDDPYLREVGILPEPPTVLEH